MKALRYVFICGILLFSFSQAHADDSGYIISLVHNWAHAWENNVNSIDWYQSFYDDDFHSNYKSKGGMNYYQWMDDKRVKGDNATCIVVSVSNFSVTIDHDIATATFFQRYMSNTFCDSGWKTLYLHKLNGNWKIIGEEQGNVTLCNDRCQ